MRVVICHNCGGFGLTMGPVMAVGCGKSDEPPANHARENETAVYPCLACNGAGYLHVVPPA